MKLRAQRCLILAFVLVLVLPAFAESPAQLKPTGYVNDFAGVIDSSTRAQMEDICTQVNDKAHAQIAVVTIHTLDGLDIESYAVDLFHRWGVGGKSDNRGVLILYAIDDHRARIEVGYGLEPILPDGKTGGFQREAIPLMREKQYSQALQLVTVRVAQVIAQDAGVELTGGRIPRQRPQQPEIKITLGKVILFVIIAIIVLATPLRNVLFWILLSNMGGGGYRGGGGGGWGGGGFGGGGGGGGFGGFGGGSSGGGGASSSW